MIKVEINENDSGQRLDRFMKKYLKSAPLSLIYRMIRKDVKLNGKRAENETILEKGDEITLFITDEQLNEFTKKIVKKKADKNFETVYEDDDILLVNKPAGLLTHGDSREKKNTLANQVVNYLYENGSFDPRKEKTFTPAPANRLDRNTSGLIIFGKSHEGLKELNRLIRSRNAIEKYYYTLILGELVEKLILKGKMIKDQGKNRVFVLPEDSLDGDYMETSVRPIYSGSGYTFAEVKLVTGRTHQIRAHLAEEGYPIIGDKKYGNAKKNVIMSNRYGLNYQFLHGYKLIFRKIDGKLAYLQGKVFEVELPEKLRMIGEKLNVIG